MKKCVSLLCALLLILSLGLSVHAAGKPVVDDGELLSSYEEEELETLLEEISRRQQLDVVVVTTDSLYGKSPRAYADDYYDNHGYGDDGILLLVSMEDRDWYISTCGYGITAFTDAGIEYIGERIVSDLSDENYMKAFEEFARLCDDFITQARKGTAYDYHNLPKEPFDVGLSLIIALVVGAVIAFIVTAILKGQLKSVKKQSAAANYIQPGSLRLTQSGEFFLYHTVSRVEKPKNNGGSGTHMSSAGRSHGGGGGKF